MLDGVLKHSQILIIDDQEANVRVLEGLLKRAGHTNVRSTTDSRKALSLFADCRPDLILLDLHMPHLDGFQIMDELRPLIPEAAYLPILVLTADITPDAKQKALGMGAKDFLTKPFDATEALLRIRNLLETRFLHLQLQDHNLLLEQKVRERTQELEEARIEILERLAHAAEFRDDMTGQHTRRVGTGAVLIAQALGFPQDQVELIQRAAPLHDVGKIGIPDAILLKPGSLTDEEFEVMKTHTTIGARILSGSRFPLLRMAEEIALTHHERWDGTGYPKGLRGDALPMAGRIVAVADAFDAMTNDRPYRKALSPKEAWKILWDGAGTQGDAAVIEGFSSNEQVKTAGAARQRHASRGRR